MESTSNTTSGSNSSSNSSRDPSPEKQRNQAERKFTMASERGTTNNPHTLEKFGITHDFTKSHLPPEKTEVVESKKTEAEITSPRKNK